MLFGVQTVAGAPTAEGDGVSGVAGVETDAAVAGADGVGAGAGGVGSPSLMGKDANTPGLVVYTLFSAPDAILLQESHPVPAGFESLLGLSVPSLYVCKKAAAAEGAGVCFSITMRDFLGRGAK